MKNRGDILDLIDAILGFLGKFIFYPLLYCVLFIIPMIGGILFAISIIYPVAYLIEKYYKIDILEFENISSLSFCLLTVAHTCLMMKYYWLT